MKLLKVLGATTLVSGMACLGTYFYNCARWEKEERLFSTQDLVRRQNPQKYEELINTNFYDLEVWEKAEAELRDSIENSRRAESNATKAYFVGGQNSKKSSFSQ